MREEVIIEWNESRLRAQLPAIRQSQIEAFKHIIRQALMRAKGLAKADPEEIWKLPLREITFHDAVRSLTARISDESNLREALKRLEMVALRGPMTLQDFDKSIVPEDKLLVKHWIWGGAKECSVEREIPIASPFERLARAGDEHFEITPEFLQGSWCLYTDKAMAKLFFFLKNSTFPRLDQIGKQAQALRQRYHRGLHLVPADERIFKDTVGSKKILRFVPFARRRPKS